MLGLAAKACLISVIVPRYHRVPGSLVESIGSMWAAYSPANGETHLLNDESVWVLECLAKIGPANTAEVARELALDITLSVDELEYLLGFGWAALLDASLVRALPDDIGKGSDFPRRP
jgi:hypothetical protein